MVNNNKKNHNSSNSLVFGRWPQTKMVPEAKHASSQADFCKLNLVASRLGFSSKMWLTKKMGREKTNNIQQDSSPRALDLEACALPVFYNCLYQRFLIISGRI